MNHHPNIKLNIDEYHQKYRKYHYPLLRKNPEQFARKFAKKYFGYIPEYKIILPKKDIWNGIEYLDYGELIYITSDKKIKNIIDKYSNRIANEYYFLKYE